MSSRGPRLPTPRRTMIIEHPTIYLGPDGRSTDALLLADGTVTAIGDEARERHTGSPVVTPEAACLFPGLADAHCHLWGVGRRVGGLNLNDTASAEDVLQKVQQVDPDALPSGWVLGRGWDDHDWPDGDRLTRRELDGVCPDVPVCLHRVDTHAIVCNSEALRRAGLVDEQGQGVAARLESLASRDGRIDRDPATGEPTGLLVDGAMGPVLDAIPEPTVAEDRRLLEEAADMYLRHGITSAHMARTELDRIPMCRQLHRDGELPMRLYLIADGEDDALPELLEKGPHHDADAWLSCRAVKFFADGALGSRGALLLDGYPDGSAGLELKPADELRDQTVQLMEAGWQIAVHAIGDRAARHVLDAYAAVPAPVRQRLRPRLEHAQMLHPEDLPRLEALDCIASIQPIHLRSDAAWVDSLLGDEQLSRLFPWADLLARTTLAGGSDYPIEDPNPWHGLATALTRRDARGRPFRPDHALSRSAALAAYTTGAARAAHWDDTLGQLRPGFAADLIALDRDPFRATPDELWDTEVLEVWLAGERVAR